MIVIPQIALSVMHRFPFSALVTGKFLSPAVQLDVTKQVSLAKHANHALPKHQLDMIVLSAELTLQ